MFKSERIMLFLLIGICLIVTIVLLDTVMDPVFLVRTVYARITNSPDPVREDIYIPEIAEDITDLIIDEAPPILQDGWEWFRNEGFAFEIQFPKQVVRKSINNQAALNYGVGVNPEAPVWKFRLDDGSLYQGTNLIDASILVHVVEGLDQEASCNAFKPGSIYQTPNNYRDSLLQVEINGVPFWKDEVIEGVMGEFYHRISYRTFTKGACYELTELIHYQNISGFSDSKLSEYDHSLVVKELDQVLESFRFLDVDPTFPEQSYPVPKTFSNAVSKATSNDVDGIDVSHWQGDIGWIQVANAGYVFAFAKGTEGVGWTDVMFHNNMAEGENAGVYMGIYHFARPDLGNTGAEEANYFLSVAGDYLKSGYLRPVLDLEVGYSLGKAALSAWVVEWMETIENRTGISPLLYTNPNFINYYLNDTVTDNDLWVAHWTCEPEPSYNVPNTGTWRDWAFWQYYGPGGCGGNAGYVPGISTNIDLNIFNGVEVGLEEYDALSQLWVSLSSDAYYVATPYYADITGNVNGDTTGLIDFSFWWDCTALEADPSIVEGACGALPSPADGECEYNDVGMRCIGVENEKQLAEHTYIEIGNYTPKVIVERGGEGPVEDRYKISTYNPLRSTILSPSPEETGYINQPYSLNASVTLHTSVLGSLQVTVKDQLTDEIEEQACISVIGDNESVELFDLSLNNSSVGEKFYEVQTKYRPFGDCPVEDDDENDLSQNYHITWIDEQPVLVIKDDAGEVIPSGTVVDLGDVEPFQSVGGTYFVSNPSTVTGLQITLIEVENAENVVNLQVEPAELIEVGPEGEIPVEVSFEVQSSGTFIFDVVIHHDATNPTPVRYTIQGNGVLVDNPIQSINSTPVSPGTSLIDDLYQVSIQVDLNAPVAGTLQVSLVDLEDNLVQEPECIVIPGVGQEIHNFEYSWTAESSGLEDYQIWAKYRDNGSCPIDDTSEYDVSQGYQVDWQEDNPVMEIKNSDGVILLSGSSEDQGSLNLFQPLTLEYTILNLSSSNSFQITGVNFENGSNVINLSSVSALPINIEAGEEIPLVLTFEVENPGDFSFDVNLEHDASNPSPYQISVSGEGVLTSNPIISITPEPLSPVEILIGEVLGLTIEVDYDAPVPGAMVVRLFDQQNNPIEAPGCHEVTEAGAGSITTGFSWSESEVISHEYIILAEFFSWEGCTPTGNPLADLSMSYQVDWQQEPAFLEFVKSDGTLIPADETIDLGQFEYYETVDFSVMIRNSSSTTSLEINDISLENLINLSKVDSNPEAGLVLDPDEERQLDISFQVDNTGPFSFDLVIEHLGSNLSPYTITFQGNVIMTNNPIKFIVPTPPSPGTSLIGSDYSLRIEVGLDAPDTGALQISLIDKSNDQVIDQECQLIEDNLDQARTFNLSWMVIDSGSRDYSILARYRAQGTCPISNSHEGDLTQMYVVNWEEDIPELQVKDGNSILVIPGGIIDLGQMSYYQEINKIYTLKNTSTTSSMEVDSLNLENIVNISGVSLNPGGPVILGPGEEMQVEVSFQVTEFGSFSFDLVLDHDASNSDPYQFTIMGSGELIENPIYKMTLVPESPGSLLVSEIFNLEVQAEINPPAPGVMKVIVVEEQTSNTVGSTCISVLAEHSLLNIDLSWTESIPGDAIYGIQLGYIANDDCPSDAEFDAVLEENYQISWQIHQPVLIVNRPEGVTIFDGMTDFVGEHEFFRFVEVTYVIENHNEAAPLLIHDIQIENMVNLREVLIDPILPIEIAPGESREIKINFQVLILEPYSFDLVWDHNGSNANPYKTSIEGTSRLNMGDGVPENSWLYKFVESLIRTDFFLKLPALFTGN